jgi:hypothetical protein
MGLINSGFKDNIFLPEYFFIELGKGEIEYDYFITSNLNYFITSDGENFMVRQ